MSVMITGGSGFIGLALAEALLARGERVVLFGLTAPPRWALRMLEMRGTVPEIVEADVCDGAAIETAIRTFKVSRLVHGAAITADGERERRAARAVVDVNVAGTVEVLEAAIRGRLSKVVQLGTGSVYGSNGMQAEQLDEVLHQPQPESLYGITKYAAERIGVRYRHTRGLDLVVARIGTAFGRWEYRTGLRDTLSLPFCLVERALTGEEVVMAADAGGDWIYSVDVAEGVLRLLDDPAPSPAPVYHLSAGRFWNAVTWAAALARSNPGLVVRRETPGKQANIGLPAPAKRSPFRVERMEQDFGWRSRFDCDASVVDYLTWLKQQEMFLENDDKFL